MVIGLLFVAAIPIPVPAAGAAEADRGLLWRIEKGAGPPSYLYATLHATDLSVPAPVREALGETRSLTVEVPLNRKAARHYREHSILEPPGSLADHLPADLFRRTLVLLSRYGVPRRRAARLEPWAAFTRLSRPPGRGAPLDRRLAERARKLGKPVRHLETMPELISALEAIPRTHQVALLKETVSERQRLRRQWAALRRHYRRGDLAAILAEAEGGSGEAHRRLMERMRVDRNRRMGTRLRERIEAGPTLAAVGALHLPGETGLLEQLAGAGYRLTPIFPEPAAPGRARASSPSRPSGPLPGSASP